MSLDRPAALLLLVLPALVLWLASRRGAARVAPTGALEWWRRARPHQAQGAARRRPPLALVLCAAALSACILALAGPRLARAGPAATWRVIVDRSPSMYLPHVDEGGGTRLDAALALLSGGPAGERRWLCWTGDAWLERAGAAPPAEWLAAPWPPLPEPPFESADLPGWLWLTDVPPARAPENVGSAGNARHAGLVAAGGAAVPGPVGVLGERWLVWDGAGVVEAARPRPSRLVVAPGVPSALASLCAVWAAERGFEVVRDASSTAELRVTTRGAATQELELTRDGWRATARVDPSGALAFDEDERRLAPWLVAGDTVVVSAAPGRIDLALGAFEPTAGTEAACAVSWARLLDRCALAPLQVVPLPERASAGAPLVAWSPAVAEQRPAPPAAWPAAALAALAALCALGAYVSSPPP